MGPSDGSDGDPTQPKTEGRRENLCSRRKSIKEIKIKMRVKKIPEENKDDAEEQREFNWKDVLLSLKDGSSGIPGFLLTPAAMKRIEFRVHSIFDSAQIKPGVFSRSFLNEKE